MRVGDDASQYVCVLVSKEVMSGESIEINEFTQVILFSCDYCTRTESFIVSMVLKKKSFSISSVARKFLPCVTVCKIRHTRL